MERESQFELAMDQVEQANGAAPAAQFVLDVPEEPVVDIAVDVNEVEPVAKAPAKQVAPPPAFSWLDPHYMFVIVLVGKDELPFGIQKDFLCAKSTFYNEFFQQRDEGDEQTVEMVVKLPDTPVEVFALAQHFLYTGEVLPGAGQLPNYEVLIGVWKLGHQLGIEGLCDNTLDAMTEYRRVTGDIPAAPLLVQAWKDTPEGSSIRKLLLSWAAEYMRSSDSRKEFARSLPQEVLSELVVAMSSLDTAPIVQVPTGLGAMAAAAAAVMGNAASGRSKNVHYLEEDDAVEMPVPAKKSRHSDVLPHGANGVASASKPGPKKGARASLPAKTKRRSNVAFGGEMNFTTEQKMNFCSDLLTRMLSGPGFWTRLVGPFKEPVDPKTDNVPDYLDRIREPMDLGTMKTKMDAGGYANEDEFLRDMRQIFNNCYTYWSKKDGIWAACERLEKTFEEKYAGMNKWIAKMDLMEEP